MAWLRLYDDILDDPKVQMLSDRAFRMFINCLALAKRNGGKLPGNMEVLAFSLRLPVGKVRDTFQSLLSAGLIDRDGDGFTPHNWHGRQYESDSAAERMRRYRERNKDRVSDEQLRPPLRNSDVPDTDSEPETEQKEEVDEARVLLTRICEILRIRLEDDPSRITWQAQVDEMLRDGIPKADILAGVEVARVNGVKSLAYVRAAAFKVKEPKEINTNGRGRRESPHEQTARVAAELIAEFEGGNSGGNSNPHDGAGLVVLRQGDDRGPEESVVEANVRRLGGPH